MFNLDRCVAFVTNASSKTLSECLNDGLMKFGVTKSQWIAMYYIHRESNLTQRELSDLMGTKESTTNGILDRIEAEGYIHRDSSENDKRKKILSLTPKGEQLNIILTDIAEDFKNQCLINVSKEDQAIFLKVLDQMVISAKEWQK